MKHKITYFFGRYNIQVHFFNPLVHTIRNSVIISIFQRIKLNDEENYIFRKNIVVHRNTPLRSIVFIVVVFFCFVLRRLICLLFNDSTKSFSYAEGGTHESAYHIITVHDENRKYKITSGPAHFRQQKRTRCRLSSRIIYELSRQYEFQKM